ncbi:MAG: hypothetical protein HY042_07190 [Spirochaetia bacterium]|nr:hypothetical protein [Spirochaetia bacterium]
MTIAPGLYKLKIEGRPGPQYIAFRWNQFPYNVILTPMPSKEYNIFLVSMRIAALTSAALLVCFFLSDNLGRKVTLLCLFFVFLGVYSLILDKAPIPLTGDEPHYMTAAESMGHDFDIDLRNNYGRHSYYSYYPMDLEPHTVEAGGRVVSFHYPLLSLLLAPAFLDTFLHMQINPYEAAKWLVTVGASFTAALASFASLLILRRPASVFIAVLCVTSLPFLAYADQIFPETAASLLILIIFLYMLRSKLGGSAPPHIAPDLFVASAVVSSALLPFLHIKFAPAAVIGGAGILLFEWSRNRKTTLALGGVLGAAALLFLFYSHNVFGRLVGPYESGAAAYTDDIGKRYLTYLYDADLGILALNPLFILVLPGLYALGRSRGLRVLLWVLALLISAHAPNLLHFNWLLGSCPSGRYWIAVVPVLAILSAQGAAHMLDAAGRAHNPLQTAMARLPLILLGSMSMLGSAAFLRNQEAFYQPIKTAPHIIKRYLQEITRMDVPYFSWSYPAPLSGWDMFILFCLTACAASLVVNLALNKRSNGNSRH